MGNFIYIHVAKCKTVSSRTHTSSVLSSAMLQPSYDLFETVQQMKRRPTKYWISSVNSSNQATKEQSAFASRSLLSGHGSFQLTQLFKFTDCLLRSYQITRRLCGKMALPDSLVSPSNRRPMVDECVRNIVLLSLRGHHPSSG
jgi:hypothetical protein